MVGLRREKNKEHGAITSSRRRYPMGCRQRPKVQHREVRKERGAQAIAATRSGWGVMKPPSEKEINRRGGTLCAANRLSCGGFSLLLLRLLIKLGGRWCLSLLPPLYNIDNKYNCVCDCGSLSSTLSADDRESNHPNRQLSCRDQLISHCSRLCNATQVPHNC